MLIFFLVLIRNTKTQQSLCYAGPGDVYSGEISTTVNGDVCEKWTTQSLIKLNKPADHNFCRVLQEMSSRPYCVYRGQKQSCDVLDCDQSTVRFQGSSFIMSRTKSTPYSLIIAQQINLYFKIFDVRKSAAVLVRVESKYDATQHISLILRNGFLKLVVSLHSYFVERFVFAGPVATQEVHYISVNRYKDGIKIQLNQTKLQFNLTSKETTFIVSPYLITVGDNFFGCMSGLSVGSWIEANGKLELLADQPLKLFTGRDLDEFSIQFTRADAFSREMCMFAPTTYVNNIYQEKPKSDYIAGNSLEGSDGSIPATNGALDKRSIIIISTSLALIVLLAVLTLICVKKNQHHRYNQEVL